MLHKLLVFSSLSLFAHNVVLGAIWVAEPIGKTLADADIAVIARIENITRGTKTAIIQLRTIQVLKGSPISEVLFAEFLPNNAGISQPRIPGLFLRGGPGDAGVWFLKEGKSAYQVLPMASASYLDEDAFLPLNAVDAATAPRGSVAQHLLNLQARWYESTASVGTMEDAKLLVSLGYAGADAVPVINGLIASARPVSHLIGLAAALRMGSVDALATVAQEFPTLRTNEKFRYVNQALQSYYMPETNSSFAALELILEAHSEMPNPDDAIASAMKRVGTKAALPVLSQILDSKDPQARLRAASIFADFAQFADADGVVRYGSPGPLASVTVYMNTPRKGSTASTEQYAQFWKQWWADHKSQLAVDAR